jgi:mannose-6-phosphate isomerase-like protein (cupin superfamily)
VESKLFGRFGDDTWVYLGHGNDMTLGDQRPSLPDWRERGWSSMSVGERLENPRTGEIVQIIHETDDLLTMDVIWPRLGQRAVTHVHPAMQERWTVIEGRAAFRIDDVHSEAGPGETRVAEPGQKHLAWNATDVPARLRIEMRPPMRWAEFVRRLFEGEDVRVLATEFRSEIAFPDSP